MARLARQMYARFIILLTLISVPAILLYVSGFRFDFDAWRVTQTGSLSVTTLPKHAVVELADISYHDTAPTIINQLLPGNYHVAITEAGYDDWEDEVEIEAGQTYQLANVILFPVEPALASIAKMPNDLEKAHETIADLAPVLQKAISDLDVSNAYQLQIIGVPEITLLDVDNATLYLLRPNGQSSVAVEELGHEIIGFAWDAETNLLLYYSKNEIFLFDATQRTSRSITRQSQPINEVVWHPRGGNVLIASGESIWTLETRLTDTPNSSAVYQGARPSDLVVDTRGKQLYFNDENQLYQLTLLP